MQKILVSICLLIISFSSFGQYDPSKINKKAQALYQQAMERAQSGNMALSAGLLLQAIEVDAKYLDAYLSLRGIYGQLKNYPKSIEYYEKAFALDKDYTAEYKLPYSINLAGAGKFDEALKAINELLTLNPPKNSTTAKAAEYRKRCWEFAVNYAKEHGNSGYVFNPVNMGDAINSAESEYFPSLTIDGGELIYTRRRNGANEDFFSSVKDSATSKWQKSSPIEGEVNTEENEGAQNISLDGEWLVFTGCNRADGMGSCDLYISYYTPTGWSEAVNMGRNINSDQWESQPCLSPDKRDIYFASRRNGGFGGSDIYVAHLMSNGKWGEPENLGAGINTAGDEQCPFLHADNQTLYFTSNQWPGYGDDDLFLSRKDSSGKWSVPFNLGYPINTISKEGTLFIDAPGTTAYYASDRNDSKGGLDIYSFGLREDIRPNKTLWVKGKVFDQKTLKGLPSNVQLIDLGTQKIASNLQTDERGNYLVTLPIGHDYAFNVNRKGYLFYSDNFLLNKSAPDSTYKKDIPLQPIAANAKVTLNNVFFNTNKYDLKPESRAELDKIVQFMQENPDVKIEISGYTDNQGKPAENLILSNNRAKAVVIYLVNHKIPQARLSSKGYGEKNPISENTTEEGKAKNRRTELRILGQ